MQKLIYKSTFY